MKLPNFDMEFNLDIIHKMHFHSCTEGKPWPPFVFDQWGFIVNPCNHCVLLLPGN